MKNILHKINSIISAKEKKQLIVLGMGSAILSLFEALSIAIIIPIMGLYIAPQKIHSYPILRSLYEWSGVKNDLLFFSILIIAAFFLFLIKFVYSIAILYKQQIVTNGVTGFERDAGVLLCRPYAHR